MDEVQPDPVDAPPSDRLATVCESLALIAAPAAGYLIPSDWRWAAGTALAAASLFVLGFFGLAS